MRGKTFQGEEGNICDIKAESGDCLDGRDHQE